MASDHAVLNSEASCAFWLYGYDMSVMGALITEEPFLSVFPQTKDPTVLGIVIASFEVGAIFGSLSCLDLGDRLGRRGTVWLGMIFMIVGGVLQTSAWSIDQLTTGRVLSGAGVGFQVATIPAWQSECCKPKTRGRWVMIEGGLLTTGLACGQWIGLGCYYIKGQAQWRIPVGIQIIPAVIVFAFIMVSPKTQNTKSQKHADILQFLPESPRWLIKHGLIEEGSYNLRMLRGVPEDDPALIAERDSIIASFEAQKGEAPFSYKELFQGGKTQTFRRVMLGVFMQAAQQLSGINMVSTYANQVLATTFNLDAQMSHLIAAAGGTEYAICSLLSVFLIEGLGRRKTFIYTAVGMTACFIVIPILLSNGKRNQQLAAAGVLFLYNTFFGVACKYYVRLLRPELLF